MLSYSVIISYILARELTLFSEEEYLKVCIQKITKISLWTGFFKKDLANITDRLVLIFDLVHGFA